MKQPMSTGSVESNHHRPTDTSGQSSHDAEVVVHYERAKEFAQRFNLSLHDIEHLTPAFWDMHRHHLMCTDTSAATILTIHYNLCIGTIIPFARFRPDLQTLLGELMSCQGWGEFMLTERDHGLDARNLETTATLLTDGSFDLHTPHSGASKAMPPSTPVGGVPRVAVVFARLMVRGNDHDVRPFIVQINDGITMTPGIQSVALPPRAGATPLDHALTSFRHVRLAPSALLGSIDRPADSRRHFLSQIHRVAIGGLALTMTSIPSLKRACYILGIFSRQRTVQDVSAQTRIPIITFRTQLEPVLVGLARAAVFDAYAQWSINTILQSQRSDEEKHGVITAFKAVVSRDALDLLQRSLLHGSWRALFLEMGGVELLTFQLANQIAEGDVLVLCVRLANELLLGRYKLPTARFPTRPLAVHEHQLFLTLQRATAKIYTRRRGGERPAGYNAAILPWSRKLIELIGQRMAVEAAIISGQVRPDLIELYESDCLLKCRSDWYMTLEQDGQDLWDGHTAVLSRLEPQLSDLLQETGCEEYVKVPILSEDAWIAYERSLPVYRSSSAATRVQTPLELVALARSKI